VSILSNKLKWPNQLTDTAIVYPSRTNKKAHIIITEKTKYRTILIDIWKVMSAQKILQKTTFNFKLSNMNGIDGYNWNSELNMSFQSKDATLTMKEIINMIEINNFNIEIKIKLKNGKILNIII
jgi:hypothetical protein